MSAEINNNKDQLTTSVSGYNLHGISGSTNSLNVPKETTLPGYRGSNDFIREYSRNGSKRNPFKSPPILQLLIRAEDRPESSWNKLDHGANRRRRVYSERKFCTKGCRC